MSFRQELNNLVGFEKDIYAAVEEIKRLRVMAENLQSVRLYEDKLKSTPKHDRMSDIVAKIVEYQENLERKTTRYVAALKSIEDKIEAIQNPDERLIINMRYIQHKKWTDIAEEVCLSESQVYRKHKIALQKVH